MVEFSRRQSNVDQVLTLRDLLQAELAICRHYFEPTDQTSVKVEFSSSDLEDIYRKVNEFLNSLPAFHEELISTASGSENPVHSEHSLNLDSAQDSQEKFVLDEALFEQFKECACDIIEIIESSLGRSLFKQLPVSQVATQSDAYSNLDSQVNSLDASQARQAAVALHRFNALMNNVVSVCVAIEARQRVELSRCIADLLESGRMFTESSEEILMGLRHLIVVRNSELDLASHNFQKDKHDNPS
jgi:hypothetical protein